MSNLDFQPVHNIESEQSVLGSLIIDSKAIDSVIGFLRPEMFYSEVNQIIFKAIIDLCKEGINVDLITLKTKLESMDVYDENGKKLLGKENMLQKIGGISYLTDLTIIVPTTSNIEFYSNDVYEKFNLRELYKTFYLGILNIHKNNLSSDEVIKLLEGGLRKIITNKTLGEIRKVDEIIMDRMNQLSDLREHISNKNVYTGFSQLDSITGPLRGGQVIVVGGRPGSGKTTFSLSIINNLVKQQKKIAFFCLEMSEQELIDKFISMSTGIPVNNLAEWHVRKDRSKEDFERERGIQYNQISEAIDYFMYSDFYIDTTPEITISKIRSKLTLLQMKGELDLVVIDYLQLITPETKGLNKVNEIGEIIRKVKIMAGELDCPIIILSQLSRDVEKRSDKRPIMSDLRDSGSIEQDANKILMLYRDLVYDKMSFNKSLEVGIVKNREGISGQTAYLYCDMSKNYIRDITQEELKNYNII